MITEPNFLTASSEDLSATEAEADGRDLHVRASEAALGQRARLHNGLVGMSGLQGHRLLHCRGVETPSKGDAIASPCLSSNQTLCSEAARQPTWFGRVVS